MIRIPDRQMTKNPPMTPALGYNPFTMAQYGVGKALQQLPMPSKMDSSGMVTPVTLRLDTRHVKMDFPFEPLVSVTGKNEIACRSVARYDGLARGSVKEKWRAGDWNITIAGILIADQYTSITDYIYLLREFVEADENIEIICPFLNEGFNITRIVVESYDFPFTKGEYNQTYTLKCKSDDTRTSLLL